MDKSNIVYLPIGSLTPYENNPRKNKDAVDAVAASIKEYGFRSPIIITEQNVVINGHTRLFAAKKLGMKEVPCVIAYGLTEEQIREYRLIDNKTSEYAQWDKDLLAAELVDLDFNLDFDFDFSGDIRKNKRWEESKKLCDLKDKVAIRHAAGSYYQSLFKSGKQGKPLREIKSPENVVFFAQTAIDFLTDSLGENLSGWAIVTTPRRRHATDFHFATAVCSHMAYLLNIPFYSDAVVCLNHDRLHPRFELVKSPEEKNLILYDDILTTGCTMRETRELLVLAGHVVYTLVSIDNH